MSQTSWFLARLQRSRLAPSRGSLGLHRLGMALLCPLALTGCGASSQESEKATTPAGAVATAPLLGKGAQCLEDATALRESLDDPPTTIHVSHILVRHRELRKPSGATRSREEACLRALEALDRLKGGAAWDDVVLRYSDASNDALGRVRHEDLSTDFANAAFALEPNQLSYVVESSRGFHIILRKN